MTVTGRTGYPELIENLWAGHQALRRCGFSSDDIYVSVGKRGEPVFTQLQIDGKEFNITCGLLDFDPDSFTALWSEFVDKFNNRKFDDEDLLHEVYITALGHWGGGVSLLTALAKKGIDAPSVGEGSAELLKALAAPSRMLH